MMLTTLDAMVTIATDPQMTYDAKDHLVDYTCDGTIPYPESWLWGAPAYTTALLVELYYPGGAAGFVSAMLEECSA